MLSFDGSSVGGSVLGLAGSSNGGSSCLSKSLPAVLPLIVSIPCSSANLFAIGITRSIVSSIIITFIGIGLSGFFKLYAVIAAHL